MTVRNYMNIKPGDHIKLRFWGGAGYSEVEGTVHPTGMEPSSDFPDDRDEDLVAIVEDDAMVYARHQVVEVTKPWERDESHNG